ncbi:hypothetical protein Cgig2_009866 [Carnegiea gigantea]|uniref:Uncharacterized protein n=1 Tax=Carnegiea gigantea TaxID=171969 RepID=A0A9Q1KNP1_9CARY|nr:hypothetical protein Cgig2_009866 [Carnegiea gigantea]
MQQSMTTFQEQQGRVNDQLRELITGLSRQIMSLKEQPLAPPPKLVTLSKAFKLAQQWVGQMSGDEEKQGKWKWKAVLLVPRKSEIRLLNDDVERRLQKKLGVRRRKSAEDERPKPLTKNETSGNSDDEENLESRTSAFANKRTPPTATQPRKKWKICYSIFSNENLCEKASTSARSPDLTSEVKSLSHQL